MHLCAHVRFRRGLVDALKQRSIVAKQIGNSWVMIQLPLIGASQYQLVPESAGGNLHIYTAERGGKTASNGGTGTVICDPIGRTIYPYYIPNATPAKWRPNFWQALIHQQDALVEVAATTLDHSPDHHSRITIMHYGITCEGNVATIEAKKLWNGRVDHLPDVQQQFRSAVDAAHTKAWCVHCRHTHYVQRRRC